MTLSRRLVLFYLCLLSAQISAQASLSGVKLQIHHVQGQVYMIQRPGGGGNIGALIGEDGVFLVDSLFAPLSEELVRTIRGVTDGDIKFGDNFFHEKIMNLLGAERLRFRLVPLIEQAALIELLGTDRIVVIDVGLAINYGRDGQHKQVVFAGEFIG